MHISQSGPAGDRQAHICLRDIGTVTKARTVEAEEKVNGRTAEFQEKLQRVRGFLKKHKLGGVLLNEQKYFSWATAGGENYVVLGHDFGVGYLLITEDSFTVLANNIEIHRFADEEFYALSKKGIEFWSCPWHEDHQIFSEVQRRMKSRKWASDCGAPGSIPLPGEFAELTYQLTPDEIERYRRLGHDCSVAMEAALEGLEPGYRETRIASRIAASMLEYNVRPHLVLVAGDERVFKYRHPIPVHSNRAKKHLMAVLCGKRGGLIINLTRMVHFGRTLPSGLRRRHDAVCQVDFALNSGTRPGRTAAQVFKDGLDAYKLHGFEEEWKLHHQGGPTGYQGRSYRGTPTETRKVLRNQAYAWNPSITGTKSEDTIIVPDTGTDFELLSGPTLRWPAITFRRGAKLYRRADIRLM